MIDILFELLNVYLLHFTGASEARKCVIATLTRLNEMAIETTCFEVKGGESAGKDNYDEGEDDAFGKVNKLQQGFTKRTFRGFPR